MRKNDPKVCNYELFRITLYYEFVRRLNCWLHIPLEIMKNSYQPTDAEMAILQILWQVGPSTVREINERLNEKKEVGYTTTLKIMQIMADKSIVVRDTSSRTHIYSAAIDMKDTQRSMLKSFIANTFGGSTTSLVLQALGDTDANETELKEIKDLIDKIEKDH